ncbi:MULTISPECIES: hypothetical protein [unclassified Siphonobacter]|uniref:hypothetical protein n=1 Tax=unclassified Siphonobacter TaxID=2635712 RepID=UPI00277D7A08|nr:MULTISPECIES: hypothetical protein [unclassified Siphonobacter]MDQ1085701.1 hypothetical protein [Siphonobacter sp. SORGH_AS_1065]MDR6195972.1 hypothetical protein [Siphonobacter sp. SORGH_AS_0500]
MCGNFSRDERKRTNNKNALAYQTRASSIHEKRVSAPQSTFTSVAMKNSRQK